MGTAQAVDREPDVRAIVVGCPSQEFLSDPEHQEPATQSCPALFAR